MAFTDEPIINLIMLVEPLIELLIMTMITRILLLLRKITRLNKIRYLLIRRIKNSGQPTFYIPDIPYQILLAKIFLLPESEDAA